MCVLHMCVLHVDVCVVQIDVYVVQIDVYVLHTNVQDVCICITKRINAHLDCV